MFEKKRNILSIATGIFIIVSFIALGVYFGFFKWINDKLAPIFGQSKAVNPTLGNATSTNSQSLSEIKSQLLAEVKTEIWKNTNTVQTNNTSTVYIKNNEMVVVKAGANFVHGQAVVITGETAYAFNPTNLTHAQLSKGIIKTSTIANAECAVQLEGNVFLAGWGLIPNTLYYFGAGGTLSPNAPSVGIVQAAGNSTTSDNFNIQLGDVRIRTA